jgi:hypothetical protein
MPSTLEISVQIIGDNLGENGALYRLITLRLQTPAKESAEASP